jgi:Fe-S-cluster containining protein
MKEINGLKIDPMIFTFRFGCKCNGECCYYGVFTDLKEYENIIRIKDKIIPLLDDTQSKNPDHWFEPPETDSDFESGVAVGTALINDKCAFLDKDGLCSLQKLANIENSHKWKHKPLYCILFPLTIYQNTLTVDHEHIERLNSCNRFNQNGTTIFEACREELIYLLGEKGFNELEKYKNDYFNEVNIGVTQNVAEK